MSSPAPSPAADDALARAAQLGIHVIPLETPFAVGTVNTYLIEDTPLTLVDCGPNTATALDRLEVSLAGLGYGIGDLEQIIITHQHLDHAGLARTVAQRSGAEVVCLDRLAPVLEDWDGHSRASDDDALALMLRHGVEAPVAEALRSVANISRGFGASCIVDRGVDAGDVLRFANRRLEVHLRPGHSPSDTVFLDRENAIALLGDHLLAHISSNALVARPLDGPAEQRPEPLIAYRASLRATRELPFTVGLAGHGPPVTEHGELISTRLAAQERRAENFARLLEEGPRSAHELASRRWGQVAVTQAYLTLSEVLGHLGLLIAAGRVHEDRSEEIIRFVRVS